MEQRLEQQQATKLLLLPPARDGRLRTTETKSWKIAWRQRLATITLVLSDILLAFLFWWFATVLRSIWLEGPLSPETIAFIVPNIAVWIGMRAILGLYPGYGLTPAEELRRQTYSTVAALAITAVFAFGLQVGDVVSRLLIGLSFLELLFLAPLVRHFVKYGLAEIGAFGKPVVILGAGETGKQLLLALQREWGLGLKPVAVFEFPLAPRGGVFEEGEHYGGTVADAIGLARKQRVDTIIFAMPRVRRQYVAEVVNKASLYFRHVIVVPNLGGVVNSAVVARDLAGVFGVEIKQNLLYPWPRRTKRALDLLGAIVGGLLISPLLLAIAALIKLDSRGPAFYGQKRPGTGGKYFNCWKFRTMHVDAESSLTKLLRSDLKLRAEWEKNRKLRDDPRITRIGRFLRKTSLDELPQLWNVLRGEMSLVGPRPMLVEELSKYGEVYEHYQRVRPGITGLWQVSGRSDADYRERLVMVAYYVRNWSVWMDLIILARTLGIVIRGRGAC